MGRRPRLLDLYCGAGGCSVGYHRAGFDCVGVDVVDQPHYPYTFIRADALEAFDQDLSGFDAVHASPPCQAYSDATARLRLRQGRVYPDMLTATLDRLRALGKPYVCENVEGARKQLDDPVMLCGSMFGLLVRRHRYFECNFPVPPLRCHHAIWDTKLFVPTYRGDATGKRPKSLSGIFSVDGHRQKAERDNWPLAMGISWMTARELTQAVPPSYTQYLGPYLRHACASVHA